MTHEERLIHLAKAGKEVRQALLTLERAGFDLTEIESEFTTLREAIETYVPTTYPDRFRIRATPIDITEHLTGNRDLLPNLLHNPTSVGRIYTLTKGQRAVLRERYGMTPTKEVKVLELAVWPASPTCVQHIIVGSTEHVPEHRRHVLNRAVIDDWVHFCEAAQAIDEQVDAVSEDKPTQPAKVKAGNENFNDLLSQYL